MPHLLARSNRSNPPLGAVPNASNRSGIDANDNSSPHRFAASQLCDMNYGREPEADYLPGIPSPEIPGADGQSAAGCIVYSVSLTCSPHAVP
jgi:hypothetical protein